MNFFENKDDGYYPQHSPKMYEVNVKIHERLTDPADILNQYPKKYHKAIIEEFADKKIEDIYWNFLEDKRMMLKEDVKYPDNLSNTKYADAFSIIKEESVGFYGRMGGHFCFDVEEDNITEKLAEIIDLSYTDGSGWNPDESSYTEKLDAKYATEVIKEAEALKTKIFLIKECVKIQKDCIPENWKEELAYRIEEYIEELKEEERKANDPDLTQQTLGQLLTSKDEVIKRHALGILKTLTK